MHITFRNITYKNFLSVGNDPVKIDFQSHDSTLIHGTNGQGKSTLIDAIHFALYGKPFRKIVNGDLINNINKKGMLVTLHFSINNTEYRIERGLKPAVFNIFENGKEREKDCSAKDFQKELEYTILKMSRDTFRQIVVLGSSSYVPFMRLNSKVAKTAIIEDLLDMQVFSKMLIVLKQSTSSARRGLKEVEHSTAIIRNSIKHTQDHIDDVRENNRRLESENLQDINRLLTEIQTVNARREKVLATLERITFDENKLSERKAAKDVLFRSISELDTQLRTANSERKFFETKSDCQYCFQPISDDFKAKKIDALDTRISTLGKRQLKSSDLHLQIQQAIEKDLEKQQAIQELTRTIADSDRKIAQLNASIDNLRDKKELSTDQLVSKIEAFNKKLLIEQGKYAKLVETVQEYLVIQEMLNETGIKSQIIKTYNPILNQLIKKYLDVLEFDVEFVFDEMFNETIKMNGRDSVTYFGLSEGQKMRIDLCLLFVFRDISRLKNSTSSNLLIFDEIGDSSLDHEGFEAFLRIIDDATTQGNKIFIISHNSELQATDRLSRSIEFKKVSNFTETIED